MPLVFVVGPPAVGKMTVGHALARRTGLRLFHNHVTSDVVTRFFDYGTPAYGRLVAELRLAEKPAKRDVDASRRHLLDVEARYRFNSAGEFDPRPDWLDGYLRLPNAELSPDAAAARVAEAFALPRA